MVEHRKHWMRHTAMVPKGFIRYEVLESIGKKPMAGSEIINEIEKRTNGHWKPSPGSIYPLLAWLQDSGHIKDVPSSQDGMKRYQLTDSGKVLLEHQTVIMEEHERIIEKQSRMRFKKEGRLFGPPFMKTPWFHLPPEKLAELRESMKGLIKISFKLGANLEDHFSESAFEDVRRVVDEAVEKLEKINKSLQGEKDE